MRCRNQDIPFTRYQGEKSTMARVSSPCSYIYPQHCLSLTTQVGWEGLHPNRDTHTHTGMLNVDRRGGGGETYLDV
jgi:hypothetical protein